METSLKSGYFSRKRILSSAGVCCLGFVALFLAGSEMVAQVTGGDAVVPAAMKHPLIPSHGSGLLGVIYLAAGSEPHPTAILFHGFPGYEQNLDLAQALRRAGWNVLAYHYRGSWGVPGTFSFLHCVEDADVEVNFVLDPKNIIQFHIDPKRIVVLGHSMGGFIAVSAAAHNQKVEAAVLLSAWNIGAGSPDGADLENKAKALASGQNLAPVVGTDGPTLAHEGFIHRAELDMLNLAPAIGSRPMLIVTANDGSDQFAAPFAAALRSAGDTHVSLEHFETDHPYSGKRLELIDSVIAFLKTE
jgi:uncharacterized protein